MIGNNPLIIPFLMLVPVRTPFIPLYETLRAHARETKLPRCDLFTNGVWPLGPYSFARWLILHGAQEGWLCCHPSWIELNQRTRRTFNPWCPTWTERQKAPTEESQRHNGWLSLPLAASPDNYCTHMQKNLMRRLPLKADVPHGETFGSATSITVLFATTHDTCGHPVPMR